MAKDYSKYTEEELMKVLEEDPEEIRFIENPSEKLQLQAINCHDETNEYEWWDESFMKNIKNPTPKVMLEAVQKNPMSLKYIGNPTEEAQLKAVEVHNSAIQCIKNPSQRVIDKAIEGVIKNGKMYNGVEKYLEQVTDEELQIKLVQSNGFLVKYFTNPSQKVKMEAVKRAGRAIEYIENPTEDMKLEAVKSDSGALRYIESPSDEMVDIAIKGNGRVLEYVNNPSSSMIMEALKSNGRAIESVENPTDEMKWVALKENPSAIEYIKKPTEEMQLYAINKNPDLYYDLTEVVKRPSDAVRMAAIKGNPRNIEYMNKPFPEDLQFEAVKRAPKTALSHMDKHVLPKVLEWTIVNNPSIVSGLTWYLRGNLSEKAQLAVVKNNPEDIYWIKNQCEKAQLEAVRQNSDLIKEIENPAPSVLAYLDSKNTKQFTKGQVASLNSTLKHLRKFCKDRGCTGNAKLFEMNGNIYLQWTGVEYVINQDWEVLSITGNSGRIDIKEELRQASEYIGNTVALISSKIPIKIKQIVFGVSDAPLTQGTYRKSDEIGSYDIELK